VGIVPFDDDGSRGVVTEQLRVPIDSGDGPVVVMLPGFALSPAHVLWANRDSLLSRSDGRAFARELGASFDVAREPDARPVDHDWMYGHPELLVAHLAELILIALG
jgi:hypothetical protein